MLLVLLGPPGAGKGTVSDLLVQKNDFIHISTGNLFREILNSKKITKTQKKIKKNLHAGKLIDDQLTYDLLIENISKYKLNKSKIILDGFPRTIRQAELLGQYLTSNDVFGVFLLKFNVSEQEVVARLEDRLICPKCGTIYHKIYHIPKKQWYCDNDGEELIKRPDDQKEKVEKRFDEYTEKTLPLFDFYSERIIEIDASKNSEEIYQQILIAIEEKL